MSILSHFLSSLLLTALFSFVTPIILVGGFLVSLSVVSYVPGFEEIGQIGAAQILEILAIFGSGVPFQGILTIGLASGLVGSLFELFNFYHYQNLRGH